MAPNKLPFFFSIQNICFLNENLCCGYSLEVPYEEASNMNKKIFIGYYLLSETIEFLHCFVGT